MDNKDPSYQYRQMKALSQYRPGGMFAAQQDNYQQPQQSQPLPPKPSKFRLKKWFAIKIKWLLATKPRMAASGAVVILLFSLLIPLLQFGDKAEAAILSQGPNSASSTSDCVDDNTGTIGTVTWGTPGNAFSSNGSKATAAVDGTTTHYVKCTNFGFSIPSSAQIVGIVVGVERSSDSTGNGGTADAAMRIVKANAVDTTGANDRKTTTVWPLTASEAYEDHGGSSDLWGNTWAASDINASNFGAAIAATKANAAGAAHNIAVDHMRITVYYAVNSQVDQNGYIWENDDSANSGSAQAAGNTAITGVRKGERLSLRMQIKNTGNDTLNTNLGLFYDQNDGNFVKVDTPTAKTETGSGCSTSAWNCTGVMTANDVGKGNSMAISPSGIPYISYATTTNGDLYVAQYVGTGGTGCATAAWTCTAIDTTNNVNARTSLAFGPGGVPYVAYHTYTSNDLIIANYVGTGGTGCATAAWTCTTVDSTNEVGQSVSLTFNSSGTPYISYLDTTGNNNNLRVAQYVGSGGTGCATAVWTCTTVQAYASGSDNYEDIGTSIAFNTNDVPYVSFTLDADSKLKVAQRVGTGGTGCTSSAWTCTTIDTSTALTGHHSSMAMSPTGVPYISYMGLDDDMYIAQYVGTGGTGCTSGLTSWTCTEVAEALSLIGTSIAFSPSGVPYVSYEGINDDLYVAQYVGSGGSGCTSSAWTCTALTSTAVEYTSIAFSPSGVPFISYYEAGSNDNLGVAQLARSGAISFSPSMNSGSITSSHADMTTVSDSGNKSDADCIGGGTWQNGVIATGSEVTISLPAGYCTEIIFTVDTSQATYGQAYRFVVASADAWRTDKGKWRGPATVASGAYATLTLGSDTDAVTVRASKDAEIEGGSCNDSNWTCATVDSTDNTGQKPSVAFSPTGVPYVAFENATGEDLRLAQYVGTGGTGCAISSWTCTDIDTSTLVGAGEAISIAFSPSGVPYISYYDSLNTVLRVAQYVGSGGTGCATSAWTCTALENGGGRFSSIAFSPSGTPYISYYDGTSTGLGLAQYVGSGGTGCNTTAWTCTIIDSANTVGFDSSLAFSAAGVPYISNYDLTNGDLRIAQYVGTGGTGCAISSWTCTVIDNANSGDNSSLAISPSGTPYISYKHFDGANNELFVAQYVGGTSGTGCTSSAWTCTGVETTNSVGENSSIAFSPAGVPYVSYLDATNYDLRVARFVSSGGSGCDSSAWTCVTVDATNQTGVHTSIAFSPAGVPFIFYEEGGSPCGTNGNCDLRFAKLYVSSDKLTTSSSYVNPMYTKNGRWSEGRFHLADGRSARTNSQGACSGGTAAAMGFCALYNDDGNTDGITAQINERPLYNFNFKVKNNTELPTISWLGTSSLAPSTAGTTGDLKLQAYRFGTTNAWTDVATDSSASSCSTNCKLMGKPGGTISEYFEADGSDYRIHVRVWQYESASQTAVFATDLVQLQYLTSQMRHGSMFENGVKRPFTF